MRQVRLGAFVKMCLSRQFNTSIKINHNIEVLDHIEKSNELHIFRIAQELINNALRHGKANLLQMELKKKTQGFELIFKDNGIGFDVNDHKKKSGIGLQNIKSRVSILNENIFLNANTSTTLINIQNIKNTATIRGSVPYGRFGTAIEFLNNLLVVGAAFQDTDTLSFNGREMGKVFAFNKVLNTSVTANVAAAWSFVGKRSGARCGSSIAILNDSIHGIRFAIGSPLAEINNKERVGVVDVLQIKLN